MSETDYQKEQRRQWSRNDIPSGHLPVHKWYLRIDDPSKIEATQPPPENVSIVRANSPTIEFYRFLYNNAGEEFLWGDRRRLSDTDLLTLISPETCHLMVLYESGTPAGFCELDVSSPDHSEIKYFGMLPGFLGRGLGGYFLNASIQYAGKLKQLPLILDTCSLDHESALENYRKRGFKVYQERDFFDPDPRLDGTIRADAGKHVPLAK